MDDYLRGSWEEFEEWIRKTIAGDFRWKVRPQDDASNRKMIAFVIKNAIERNDGKFPDKNSFIERVEQ